MLKRLSHALLRFGLALVGVFVSLWLAGWLLQPTVSDRPVAYPEDVVRDASAAREPVLDPADPPVIYREVDYTESESAAWFPKGEPPLLAPLVEAGDLPPVAERVGPEPVVMEGVEGIGRYGGTWVRLSGTSFDAEVMTRSCHSYANLVRWSPQGYPIVPHIAKSYEVSDDNRVFTFTLRRGMRWSDGHPFTADDILYWWEDEVLDPVFEGDVTPFMQREGKAATVEKLGPYQFRVHFEKPFGAFLIHLASSRGVDVCSRPAHYLRQYHPRLGDPEKIASEMARRKIDDKLSLYWHLVGAYFENPEYPRLWPWIYRTYTSSPPYAIVRNPYYFAVDTEGNQLPYVDRILYDVKSPDMLGATAANGDCTMQAWQLQYDQYTHLMSQRERNGYDIYHWYPATRGDYVIFPNLNRRIDPDDPGSKFKHAILNEKRFRQALSLAINRQDIIDAELNGQAYPAQCAPGPQSPFHVPELYNSHTQFAPDDANRLLDEMGLTQWDREGFRTFPDGSRMVFFLNTCDAWPATGVAQFISADWARVGIRAIVRERSRVYWSSEQNTRRMDFYIWSGNMEYLPLMLPTCFVPAWPYGGFAQSYARWYLRGGLYGDPRADSPGALEPPVGHPIRRAMEVFEAAQAYRVTERQANVFREALLIAAENLWSINVCTPPPSLTLVKNGLRNVPRHAVFTWEFQTPGNAGMETYFFDEPYDSPGAVAAMRREVLEVTPHYARTEAPQEDAPVPQDGASGMLRALIAVIAVLSLVMVAVRHPYIARRLLIMAPTLLVISIVVFTAIQLPPGDFVTMRIMELQESGRSADLAAVERLRDTFHLEDPVYVRYLRWLGVYWFLSFDEKDTGLLQGNMGRSMQSSQSANDLVGDRITLTFCISLFTILFTWAVALPIGMLSAVRRYSLLDYAVTFVGFLGMCIPPFLLALVLTALGGVSGLFSAEYAVQPEWSWGKVADLMRHIWVPVVVLGVGGTAGMIRVMRGNLLDELGKPYVVAARARGVRPLKLLLKYPVRIALNPFISGIGALFPQLVSGGAIVAVVLSLPTVGPMMLSALMNEDMFLAGSMLMVLSLLGVAGTLVSDLLLLWLDPRIRFQGGTR